MTLDTILGVVGCVLSIAAGCVVAWLEDRYTVRLLGDSAPLVACLLTAAIYWTALIVWLVMR
jgi:hypothetical protein